MQPNPQFPVTTKEQLQQVTSAALQQIKLKGFDLNHDFFLRTSNREAPVFLNHVPVSIFVLRF